MREKQEEEAEKLLPAQGSRNASASRHSNQPTSTIDELETNTGVHSTDSSNAWATEGSSSKVHIPMIIGLYGVSGVGKTHLLKQLAQTSLSQHLDFVDSSTLIDGFVGLAKFSKMEAEEQDMHRAKVMSGLAKERSRLEKGIVIGGHMMFWDGATKKTSNISIKAEWETYTHMVYLQVDPKVIHQRRKNDKSRDRDTIAVENLDDWQMQERAALRKICYERRIPFTTITEYAGAPKDKILGELQALLRNFLDSNEEKNLSAVDSALDFVISQHNR